MKMPRTQLLRDAIIKSASTYNQPIWLIGIAGLAIHHYFGHNKNRTSDAYLSRAEEVIMEMVNEGILSLTDDHSKVMPITPSLLGE